MIMKTVFDLCHMGLFMLLAQKLLETSKLGRIPFQYCKQEKEAELMNSIFVENDKCVNNFFLKGLFFSFFNRFMIKTVNPG